jgi:addiction module RelB/DinJ family antitoxin
MSAIQTTNLNQSDFIQVRLDPKTKKAATSILDKLGLSPSQAIKIFLNQVIITRAIPFSIGLPADYVEELSDEQSAEVGLAIDQIKKGKFVNIDMSDRQKVKKYLGV